MRLPTRAGVRRPSGLTALFGMARPAIDVVQAPSVTAVMIKRPLSARCADGLAHSRSRPRRQVGPINLHQHAHGVHGLHGAVFVDGLDRHHRYVLVVG